eukprot:INCI5014.6.p1 GENE.INCI5014.6~~INCI5014.6.p1  ORF type:complete len:619 (-),score=76.20 INCI5014.6:406-2262(-)
MLIYAFLATWVLLVDTVVSQQRYMQQHGQVSSSQHSSAVVRDDSSGHWLMESLPGRAGYLCLFVYLAVGGFQRDIVGPLIISLQIGEFSNLASIASLGLLLGVLLVAWLAVKCVLARSALDCEGEVRWVTRQEEAAAQRELKVSIVAAMNRQREAAVAVASSESDMARIDMPARHKHSESVSVDRGATVSPDAVFVDQRVTRDALLPFCHCSAAEWTKHVDATRKIWTVDGGLSSRLTFFLPASPIGEFWFIVLSDLILQLHFVNDTEYSLATWPFWVGLLLQLSFLVIRDTNFFGLLRCALPHLAGLGPSSTPVALDPRTPFSMPSESTLPNHRLLMASSRNILARRESASLRLLSSVLSLCVVTAVLLAELVPIEVPTDPAASNGRNASLVLDLAGDLTGPNTLGLRYVWSGQLGAMNGTAFGTRFLGLLSCEEAATDFLPASSVVWFRLPASGVLECMGRLLLVAFIQISVAVVNDCFARRTHAVYSDVGASADKSGFAGADALTDLSNTQAATMRRTSGPATTRDSEPNAAGTAEHGARTLSDPPAFVATGVSALPPSPALTSEDTAFYMKLFWERHFVCMVCVSLLTVWWTLHYFYMAQLWKLVTCINGTSDA